MQFIRGIMLEGISSSGKTSTLLALKELHTQQENSERSIIVLGEHYSQVLQNVGGKLVRLEREEHLHLLRERLSMLEKLGGWASTLGPFRRRSRGIFVVFERFYLNHVAAFGGVDSPESAVIADECTRLGLRSALLTLPREQMARRLRMHGLAATDEELEDAVARGSVEQDACVKAAGSCRVPTLTLDTTDMDWTAYARAILDYMAET